LFHRRRPADVASELAVAGLQVYAQTVREADDDGVESTPQAILIARKICFPFPRTPTLLVNLSND
jgi:hypothetical protein